MANRRMFSKEIIDSDMFLDMPLSSQTLYFHLAMRADDDGFVNNAKKISRMIIYWGRGKSCDFSLSIHSPVHLSSREMIYKPHKVFGANDSTLVQALDFSSMIFCFF